MRKLLSLPLALAICVPLTSCNPLSGEDVANLTHEAPPTFVAGDQASAVTAERMTYDYLNNTKLGMLRGVDEVWTKSVKVDKLGMVHTRLTQTVDNIPVFGGVSTVHLHKNGLLRGLSDGFVRDIQVDTRAELTEFEATDLAVGATGGWAMLSEAPETDLQILRHEGRDHLTYRVQLKQFDLDEPAMPVVFIDAHTGYLVMQYNNLQNAKNRRTYDGNNGSSLPGTLVRTEGSGNSGDAALDDAHNYSGITYDCYNTLYGRDSYDDNGATLHSTVHHRSNYNNAFWNGSQMVYGDGDGSLFFPLSGSLDVVAHEITHAVTSYSSNLIYQNESGAVNEGMSDIFAARCEAWHDGGINPDVWKIGDEIFTPATPGDALRYMDNPTVDGSSYDYYPERYTGSADNGGVHWNSGIANLAFYLLSVGGTHPRGKTSTVVPAIGIEKAGQIFYRANNVYLVPSSNFAATRTATVNAANDLYGATEAAAVDAAWDAVGVPGGGGGPGPTDCSSYNETFTGSLSGTGSQQFQPNGTYWYDGNGDTSALLNGPGGTDFDLYLWKWQGGWVVVADSLSGTSTETINYNGSAGYFAYRVYSYSGSGGYTLCMTR